MTEFKQIIGRGSRIQEDYGKFFFTIMDFKKATELFADPEFDGDPVQIYEPGPDDSPVPPEEWDIEDEITIVDPLVPGPGGITGFTGGRRTKYVVNDVEVCCLIFGSGQPRDLNLEFEIHKFPKDN